MASEPIELFHAAKQPYGNQHINILM